MSKSHVSFINFIIGEYSHHHNQIVRLKDTFDEDSKYSLCSTVPIVGSRFSGGPRLHMSGRDIFINRECSLQSRKQRVRGFDRGSEISDHM